MSKLDFITYAKSLLIAKSNKLKSETPPNNSAAGRLDRIANTAGQASHFLAVIELRLFWLFDYSYNQSNQNNRSLYRRGMADFA